MADPTDAALEQIEALAADVAAQAGAVLIDRFRGVLDVRFKDRQGLDPVTEVDHAVEDLVRRAVTQRFPEHAVLGEEGDDTGPPDAAFVWAVDPLDGTSNFVNGLPLFTSSIGVLWRGEPVVGAIFAPFALGLEPGVYHGRRGGVLCFNGEPVRSAPAPVGQAIRLAAVPGGIAGMSGPKGRRFGIARTLGSIALELALTAEGSFRYCIIGDGKLWDVAAGVALCLAAGRAVFVQPARGGDWLPLDRFVDGEPTLPALRAWNHRLMAGDPEILPQLGRDLAREQRAPAVLRRLLFRA